MKKIILVGGVFAAVSGAFYYGFKEGHAQCKKQVLQLTEDTDWHKLIIDEWRDYPQLMKVIQQVDMQKLMQELVERKIKRSQGAR
jgi:hypothetical protein